MIGGEHIVEQHGERGAALIIVLGLVALISTWAISAGYDDMLALRRAENSQDALRARQASQSALALTAKVLREDAKESRTDDLDEIWAQASPPFPVDDGVVTAELMDTNRLINLNNLVDQHGKAVPAMEQIVKGLFLQLELDVGLVDALIDWMDVDHNSHGSGGAEDSSYYDKDYHVKNARMDRWDELLLVRGFKPAMVEKLSSLVTIRVVPKQGFSTVNINTANAPVLMAMMPKMTESDAQIFISERPFDAVAQALQNRPWAAGINQTYLSVASDVFMVRTEAQFGRVTLREKYMLRRDAGKITVLSIQHAGQKIVRTTDQQGTQF